MNTYKNGDLTPKEVAALLKVSVATVYRHLRSGALESYRLGGPRGSYRVPTTSIEKFKWERR